MALEQREQVDSKAEGGNSVNYNSEDKYQRIAYSLGLSKSNIVVLSVHQVILVERTVLRWHGVSSIPHP